VTAASAGTTLTSTVVLKPTQVIGTSASGILTKTKYDATPAQGTTVTVMTHVQNGAGAPMRGIKVVHRFKHAGGAVLRTTYTDSGGNAWTSRNLGDSRAGTRVYVQADAYGGTRPSSTYDGVRSDVTSFVPHSGVASFKASRVTPAVPVRLAKATVEVRCVDDHGAPIVGRIVGFQWVHKSGPSKTQARTDSNGYAYVSRKIGNSEVGFKMRVTASVKSGSKVKKSLVVFKAVRR